MVMSKVIATVKDTIAHSRELMQQADEQIQRTSAHRSTQVGNAGGFCEFTSPMRRFHFHIANGTEVFDSLGALLADDAAALKYAEKLARDLARTKLADSPAKHVRVTNEDGDVLFSVPVRQLRG